MSFQNDIQTDHFSGGANLSQAEAGDGPHLQELLKDMEGPALKEQVTRHQAGTVATATTLGGPFIAQFAGKITAAKLHVGTTGASGATTVDVNIDGTTIFGTNPTVDNTDSDGTVNAGVVDTAANTFAAGALITVDIDAAPGSGADATIQVEVDYNA